MPAKNKDKRYFWDKDKYTFSGKRKEGENESYHQTPHHKHAVCKRCGRSYPETILNIEAKIHHHAPYECLNRKECQRAKRKGK